MERIHKKKKARLSGEKGGEAAHAGDGRKEGAVSLSNSPALREKKRKKGEITAEENHLCLLLYSVKIRREGGGGGSYRTEEALL